MKIEVIISIVIGICGAVLFSGLLIYGKIGAPSYVILISVLALVCLVIPVFKRLRELDLKNLKLTLDRIEEAKAEVFAKEEDLRNSTLLLAELITANSAVAGIWGDEDSNKYSKTLIQSKTRKLLENINVPQSKIDEIFKYQNAIDSLPETGGEEHDRQWKAFINMLKEESEK